MKRLFLGLFSLFLLSANAYAEDGLNPTEQDDVRKLVRETLLANPEILVEAMEILQSRQEQARLEQQKEALKNVSFINDITPVQGNKNGDITMVEFFDYQCGYCKRAFPGVMEVVNGDKNLRYVLKELAILGPESETAARAALAASLQGKYMELHTALMTIRGRLSEEKILKTAASVGLDVEKLKIDMQSDKVTGEIISTRQTAQSLGISGTPAFVINDQIIPGAVPGETLKQVIEQQRAAKQ